MGKRTADQINEEIASVVEEMDERASARALANTYDQALDEVRFEVGLIDTSRKEDFICDMLEAGLASLPDDPHRALFYAGRAPLYREQLKKRLELEDRYAELLDELRSDP